VALNDLFSFCAVVPLRNYPLIHAVCSGTLAAGQTGTYTYAYTDTRRC